MICLPNIRIWMATDFYFYLSYELRIERLTSHNSYFPLHTLLQQHVHSALDGFDQMLMAYDKEEAVLSQNCCYFTLLFSLHTWTSLTHSPFWCVFWLAALHECCPGHWMASSMESASFCLIRCACSVRCWLVFNHSVDDGEASSPWRLIVRLGVFSRFYCPVFDPILTWPLVSLGVRQYRVVWVVNVRWYNLLALVFSVSLL